MRQSQAEQVKELEQSWQKASAGKVSKEITQHKM
jgi:hypothetical protein